jgi:ABC-type transport system involved in multi-copper enzyme maturation permease subunit
MFNPFQTRFGAIFLNEVLINSKRVAPYALMVLSGGLALLWWYKGPAAALGWATNSDFYIARNLKGFSFLGLPIFNAVIMGDPVIRDFRLDVVPLIFSKPINRAQYLFGKFFGSFFVLVCCQAAFPLTLLALQAFRPARMVVQIPHVLLYFKHFFFFVVITHLALAALYFSVGAITRNSKLVYGLAVCFYPFYISLMLFLFRGLPVRGRSSLDLFLLNSGPSGNGFGNSAEFLNAYVYIYSTDMIANRAVILLISAACLLVLYWRFSITERGEVKELSVLDLSSAGERIHFDAPAPANALEARENSDSTLVRPKLASEPLPQVTIANERFGDSLKKLVAALRTEFRLLRAERSLIVLLPLALVFSIFDVAFFRVVPEVSYSATYAGSTANAMLLFLIGMSVFYTGEAMHRDRELRIETVLWATPAPNYVLLLSKFLATLGLTFSFITLSGLAAITAQLIRRHPIEIQPYLLTYSIVLIPAVVFMAAFSVMLNVLLRNKYLVYAVSIGIGSALFYLYGIGYNRWPYNPVLYHLWNYADLASGNLTPNLSRRLYWLVLAVVCLLLAHLFYQRKSAMARE